MKTSKMRPSSTILLPLLPQYSLQQFLLFIFILLLLSSIPLCHYHFLNLFLLFSPRPVPLPTPPPKHIDRNPFNTRTYTRNCNFANGDWVPDRGMPYYNNLTCLMIHERRNCLKYGRPDTGFLNWRWKPDGCDLPRFDQKRFLEIVRGKSMAFVGDSLARNHMQSLICLLSSVEYPKEIPFHDTEDFKHMFYENHNFTIKLFWSAFLVNGRGPETNDPDGLFILHLDEVDEKWFPQIADFDYVIISDGIWFVKPSLFYENGQVTGCNSCQSPNITDLTLRYSNRMAFRTAFSAINRLQSFKGMVFFRTLLLDHFENGDWDKGGDCVRTRPFMRNEVRLSDLGLDLYKIQLEEFMEAQREGRKRGLEFKLLDVTQAMLLRPDGHPSHFGHWPEENVTFRNDCVHWCLPGPIDVWNEFLFHMMY